jgi:hypothetical protein
VSVDPKRSRTSDVIRNGASWLSVLAHDGAVTRATKAEIEALISELRLRARWIETARSDTGVSVERMAGIAMIEDPS